MKFYSQLLLHLFIVSVKLLTPGGVKAVMAENIALRQQLLVLNRGKKRTPPLTTCDRFIFGLVSFVITPKRIRNVAIILKPATILKFHKILVSRKYRKLYSSKTKKAPGRKPLDQAVIDLIVEMKQRNPTIGYGRIAMQIYQSFGIEISRFAVGRILRKNKDKLPPSDDGPSWLTFLGHMKDSLWSVDLFRCESIALKSHWVMVVMDQFSRRIIGFAVYVGDCDGVAYCRMFNEIIAGKSLPKYLSSDNDPLFLYHRWVANLSILEIEEIKSVPCVPTSHPFVERVILTCRSEFLDRQLFWNATDLRRKLEHFKEYYNETRAHSSLDRKTPAEATRVDADGDKFATQALDYRWQSHCSGMYQLPVAT